MKIVILGPAHPYRGGLAAIMETMAREYQSRGDEVKVYTFSLQYPSLLFPGKSQTGGGFAAVFLFSGRNQTFLPKSS